MNITDPKKLLTKLRGCDKICGCGKELIPVIVKGKQIGVQHITFEDEEWHMKFWAGIKTEIQNENKNL
jgi:hypothetical protein